MRVVVDTGVFSASLSRRRRTEFKKPRPAHELRYGARVAQWGDARRRRLEQSIQTVTVVPVSDQLLSTVAELRYECRRAGHALHDPSHANDLWIAASAIHIEAPLLTADRVFEGAPGLTLLR